MKKILSSKKEKNLLSSAITLHQQGNLKMAREVYQSIINKNPKSSEALQLLGTLEAQSENYIKAIQLYDQSIDINSNNPIVFNNKGGILQKIKSYDKALDCFNKAIFLNVRYVEAYYNKGLVYADLKDILLAIENYDRALSIDPRFFKALFNKANLLASLDKIDQAIDYMSRAIHVESNNHIAHNAIGCFYLSKKDYHLALKSFMKAIEIKNDFVKSYINFSLALKNLGQVHLAIESCNTALKFDPTNSEAFFNKGVFYESLQNYEKALESYDFGLNYDPRSSLLHLNKGNALFKLHKFELALSSYEKSKLFDASNSDLFSNCGAAHFELGNFESAMENYNIALEMNPNNFQALINRGTLNNSLSKFPEAELDFQKCFQIEPEYPFLLGLLFESRMFNCDWTHYKLQHENIVSNLAQYKEVISPFSFITLIGSASLEKIVTEVFVKNKFKNITPLSPINLRPIKPKIKIGYFSADFHNHATAYLMAQLFELHDRDKFEIIAFSFGLEYSDQMKNRLLKGFDKFYDVHFMSDQQVALFSRELEIDIAIDLKGYTRNSRTGIFALRAAPIQVNYLGYPGTMGCDFIDYIIADPTIIPESHRQFYSEKIAYLPHSYQVNDNKRVVSSQTPLKSSLGLPENGFIFCCFNSIYKITPGIFAAWMRILSETHGSVLWLLEESPTAVSNLCQEAKKNGIAADRLIFSPKIDSESHLARCKLADLFLDTHPTNAHTTASDALWVGLPLITLMGESFCGRVASSLLSAIGMQELITKELEDYERLAIKIANDRSLHHAIRHKLQQSQLNCPLFDTKKYTANLESLFVQMYDRFQDNLLPENIFS